MNVDKIVSHTWKQFHSPAIPSIEIDTNLFCQLTDSNIELVKLEKFGAEVSVYVVDQQQQIIERDKQLQEQMILVSWISQALLLISLNSLEQQIQSLQKEIDDLKQGTKVEVIVVNCRHFFVFACRIQNMRRYRSSSDASTTGENNLHWPSSRSR